MEDPGLSRRDVLKISAVGAAALAVPLARPLVGARASEVAAGQIPRPYSRPFVTPPVLQAVEQRGTTPVYQLVQRQFSANILASLPTRLLGYNGMFPGPTIEVTRGRPVIVRQVNQLSNTKFGNVETSTHLHGAPSLPQYDGYANDLSRPGFAKEYRYDNSEDARTLWYHDHAVHVTARNVYHGLAALYINRDGNDSLLPPRELDLPLIISDAAFASNGDLLFDDRGHSGVNGDVIMVNGVPWPALKVMRRRYRFRILGASTARAYRLYLTRDGTFSVLSNDGGFLRAPARVSELPLSMAERYGVVIDFAQFPVDTRVELRNRGVPNAIDYDDTDKVMAFDVVDDSQFPAELRNLPDPELPATLPYDTALLDDARESDAVRTRELRFERGNGEWQINKTTWEEVEGTGFQRTLFTGSAQPDITPGSLEVWKLTNHSGGWFHPIHLHLVDFKILSRNGRPPAAYESGPKDVVYLHENEEVRLIARFGGGPLNRTGRYMIHCHNTSHEDFDMMHQFRVGPEDPALDPITADPPKPFVS
jgi:spore coat protein A, manganese oxidase